MTGTEPTSFTGIESLIVNGTGALTLQGGASDDLIAVSPTTRTARINAGPLVSFPNITAVTADGQGSVNDLVQVTGSPAGDAIAVDRTARTVVLAGVTLTVNAASESLLVNGGLGDDTFTVTGSGGPALTIDGGGQTTQSPGDTLSITNTTAAPRP